MYTYINIFMCTVLIKLHQVNCTIKQAHRTVQWC